jgi:hypothetical protein
MEKKEYQAKPESLEKKWNQEKSKVAHQNKKQQSVPEWVKQHYSTQNQDHGKDSPAS